MSLKLVDRSLSILNREDIYIRDSYIDKLKIYSKTKNVIVIQGQRRVGKSYVVLGLLKKLQIEKKQIFYFNKEYDVKDSIATASDLEDLFDEFIKERGEPTYVVIDEIQDIKDWERFIRAIYADKKYQIIISGSNSQLLSGELATHLTGRVFKLFVYPFSYKEYREYMKQVGRLDKLEYSLTKPNDLYFYIESGGLPEAVMAESEVARMDYIKSTMEDIMLKDIIKRYNIRDMTLLGKVIGFIANTVGSIVSVANITNFLKSDKSYGDVSLSTATISSYLKYLQYAFVINKAERFDLIGKKILEYKEKYYFTDVGVRNLYFYDNNRDITKIIENIVYMHLKRLGYEVFVGELKEAEVDFVAKKDDKKVYIQVSYLLGDNEKTKEREFGNLLKIKDNHQKMVLSMDDMAKGNIDGIEWRSVRDFLENFE